jgi:cytochrome c oxidase subunit 2
VNIPNTILAMLVGILLTLVSLWYGQNHGLLPVAASDEAAQVDGLFNTMMTVATGLFIIVQGTLVIAAIRFRKRKGDNTDGPPVHGNVPLEILWTALPAVVVAWISIYSFEVYNAMGGFDPMAAGDSHAAHMSASAKMRGAAIAAPLPAAGAENPSPSDRSQSPNNLIAVGVGASPANRGQNADVSVNVTGLQYAWIFNYPDSNVSSGELHLPADKEAQLNISAMDVLHAIWIPELRLKQDAIPGRTVELRFTPRRVGEYPLRCAELCGSYHGSMATKLIVQTPEDYASWLQSQQVASNPSLEKALAVNPANLSDSDFLASYATEMGMNSETAYQIHHAHH